VKVVYDINIACPVSGLRLSGRTCEVHMIPLMLLDNGTIMGYCPNHKTRVFISDRITSYYIQKTGQVIDRIPNPPKPLYKERKHGPT
jgi:hypothetical protein